MECKFDKVTEKYEYDGETLYTEQWVHARGNDGSCDIKECLNGLVDDEKDVSCKYTIKPKEVDGGGKKKKPTAAYVRSKRKVHTPRGPRCVYTRRGHEYVKLGGEFVTVRAATRH